MSSQITVEKAVPLELGIYKVKFLICKISFFSLLQALLGKNLSSATDHLTILGQSMYTSELHVDSKLWTEWKWIFGKYFRLVCQLMLAEQTQILFYNSLVCVWWRICVTLSHLKYLQRRTKCWAKSYKTYFKSQLTCP